MKEYLNKKDLTILYAEDDKMVREAVTKGLEILFTKVYVAEDGIEALNIMKRHSIDVLVSDMNMPGLDGATLIRKVRAKYKDMPIIITTGHSEFEGVYKNVFNIETLTKPYTVMEILDAINNFTRNKEIVKKCDDAYEKIEEVFIEAQRVLDLIK